MHLSDGDGAFLPRRVGVSGTETLTGLRWPEHEVPSGPRLPNAEHVPFGDTHCIQQIQRDVRAGLGVDVVDTDEHTLLRRAHGAAGLARPYELRRRSIGEVLEEFLIRPLGEEYQQGPTGEGSEDHHQKRKHRGRTFSVGHHSFLSRCLL